MKRLLLLLLAITTLISCDFFTGNEPVKDYLVLSGKIYNLRKKSVELVGFDYKHTIDFDRKKKKFSDTIRGVKPGMYTLKVGKRPIQIYLDSTKNLHVIADAKKRTKRPKFKGDSTLVKINKFLIYKLKKHETILGNANKLFGAEEKAFGKRMKKYRNSINKLGKRMKLPSSFMEKEKRNVQYEYARNLNNYKEYHGLLTGNDEFEDSGKFKKEVNKIDFNNKEDYIFSFSYRMFLKEYLKGIAIQKLPEDGDLDLTYVEIVNDNVEENFIKNDLLYNVAKSNITYTTDLPTFYKKIMSYSTNEKKNKEITELYDKLKLTAKGQPSPVFEDYKNFEGGKTSLTDLTNKGKYLYIDIWATWCGFCKKEVPLLKNFEEKYHGKNIEFVSINVNTKDQFDIWKKTVKDKEMGGVQLFAGQNIENLEFAQKYLIVGLPRFILLDPEGKVISPNAPRPSDGYKLDDLFEEYGIGE